MSKYQSDFSDTHRLMWMRNILNGEQSTSKNLAKSTTIQKASNPQGGSNVVIQSSNTPRHFNSLIQKFDFSPPSDNLWNVEIRLKKIDDSKKNLKNDNNNLLQLYTNIKAVNKTWNDANRESWHVNVNRTKSENDDYIRQFCNTEMGVFLAQSVQFSPISLNFDDNVFGELQQLGGFYKNAKVVKSIKHDDNLKINFLVSNYDITDILIEPWIAAIAQRGLIEIDDDIRLKAQIILTEFSSSYPKKPSEKTYEGQMKARKQYIFDNCFPTSRDEIKKEYSQNEAGTYKNQVVSFKFDSYKIKYLF